MAGSMPATAPASIVRQGSKLIIPAPYPGQAVALPSMCVRCGAAADGKPVKKWFAWHNPFLYVLLISPVIYVIVALIVRKRMKISVPLCAQHAQRRSLAVTLAWVLPLIGIADAFVLPRFSVDSGLVTTITFILILAGLVIWAVVANPIKPTFIGASRGEFIGFCATFLQQFPEGVAMTPSVPQPGVPPPPLR
jgi:hypothetical protein